MKNAIIAAVLLASSSSALAADYFLVVPLPSRAEKVNVQVTLNGASLPAGKALQAYSGFDFNSVLRVEGDAQFNASGVAWSITGGALPAGLMLGADGRITGTPVAHGSTNIQVRATYKTKVGQQDYQLSIAPADVPARLDAARFYVGPTHTPFEGSNTTLNSGGTVWTVGARPAAYVSKSMAIEANAVSGPDDAYVEVVSSTSSAWAILIGADGKQHGVALDGPGCMKNSVYIASCTNNGTGNWANARLGLRYERSAGRVTIYHNGIQAYQTSGISPQALRLRVQDRDVPANPYVRTFTVYNTQNGWLYAPAGVQPFRAN